MYNKNQRIKIVPGETKLQDFPLWCERCKQESTVDFDGVSQNPLRSEPTA